VATAAPERCPRLRRAIPAIGPRTVAFDKIGAPGIDLARKMVSTLEPASNNSASTRRMQNAMPAHMEVNMRRISLLPIASLIIIGIVSLAGWSQAQVSGGASSPKSGTRLITLGTRSGPQPMIGRAQSSNLLIVNGTQYLIDAGDGVTRRLIRLGTNFRNIEDVFITHPHSDHTGGLGALMGVIYDLSRTRLVNIYGPPGTEASV
jgi:Metallo-beta-lactamase superfamily